MIGTHEQVGLGPFMFSNAPDGVEELPPEVSVGVNGATLTCEEL